MKRFVTFLLTLFATAALADDAYVLRMNAFGAPIGSGGCLAAHWSDDVLFFNTTPAGATVSVLDASYSIPQPVSFVVPAGRSTTLREALGTLFDPQLETRIGVLHLDVPRGVTVSSRMMVYEDLAPGPGVICPFFRPAYILPIAVSPLPTRGGFVPANQAQAHLAADFGGPDARISVAIYNSGDSPANATVELRNGCDGGLMSVRSVLVGAGAVAQVSGLAITAGNMESPCKAGFLAELRRDVVVTVDRPSMTWVTVTQQSQPAMGLGVAVGP
jgi:hypothetical protein